MFQPLTVTSVNGQRLYLSCRGSCLQANSSLVTNGEKQAQEDKMRERKSREGKGTGLEGTREAKKSIKKEEGVTGRRELAPEKAVSSQACGTSSRRRVPGLLPAPAEVSHHGSSNVSPMPLPTPPPPPRGEGPAPPPALRLRTTEQHGGARRFFPCPVPSAARQKTMSQKHFPGFFILNNKSRSLECMVCRGHWRFFFLFIFNCSFQFVCLGLGFSYGVFVLVGFSVKKYRSRKKKDEIN